MRASDIPLPRGIGYLLPQQRADEVIMYGPGSLGFQMTRASARGAPRQGLILWQHPGMTRTAQRPCRTQQREIQGTGRASTVNQRTIVSAQIQWAVILLCLALCCSSWQR